MIRNRRTPRRGGHVRLRCTAIEIGVAAALVLASTGAAPALAGTGRASTRKVSFTTSSGPPVSFAPTCDAARACLVPVSGGPESSVSGDLNGTGVYAGAARLLGSNEAISSALATFTGTVKGCGTGTITIRYAAHYSSRLPHGGGGTWEVVGGVGTGALSHLTGRGTFTVGTVKPDLSGTDSFEGTIHC